MGNSSRNKIFAFVAASGSGKTTMVEAAVRELAGQLQVIKSATTRKQRGPDDAVHYDFFSTEEFEQMYADGELAYKTFYASNYYGILTSELDRVLGTSHGILALVEESVRLLRKRGYEIRVMKIIKKGAPEFPDALRNKVDAERAKDPLEADIVIVNAFDEPGGLQRATAELVTYIKSELAPTRAA